MCLCSVCVRALSARVHVRMDACARRRRIAESNRTVQQAQAAGRAGEAAKNYSSRYLKLRGEQRERRNFSVHGKNRHVGLFSPFSSKRSALDACGYFIRIFFIPFVFFHLSIWGAGAHAARATVGDETKDPADLMGEREEN